MEHALGYFWALKVTFYWSTWFCSWGRISFGLLTNSYGT
jgi:hypothetical protein